jgi:hypothetical protein
MRTLDSNRSSSEQTCEDSSSLPRATVIFDRRADRRASTCDDQNGRQSSWRFESRPVASLLLRHWTPGIHKDIFLPVSHHQFPVNHPFSVQHFYAHPQSYLHTICSRSLATTPQSCFCNSSWPWPPQPPMPLSYHKTSPQDLSSRYTSAHLFRLTFQASTYR